MKYIIAYENKINQPKVNDYVICRFEDDYYSYLNDTFGQIEKSIHSAYNTRIIYIVKFANYKNNFYMFWKTKPSTSPGFSYHTDGEIIHFSSNLEDIKSILVARKYNL